MRFRLSCGQRGWARKPFARYSSIRCSLEGFRIQLAKPDHVTVSRRRAKKWYLLHDEDLDKLMAVEAPNPYGDENDMYELYWLSDVVQLAKTKHPENVIVNNYKQILKNAKEKSTTKNDATRVIYGMSGTDRWYRNPSSGTPEGKKSIEQGLKSNLTIFCGKLLVSKATGSFALFADAMHSLADVCNYMYRYYSLSQSTQQADQKHPYGYAPLRHICADRSFVCLLLVGGAIPISVGVYELGQLASICVLPPHEPTLALAAGAVLVFSMVMEGLAMRTASQEMAERAKTGKKQEIMSSATYLEARAGVYGSLVGLLGVMVTATTGSPVVEIGCSAIMGSVVAGVACHLLSVSGTALLGATLPVDRVTTVIEMLQRDEVVVEIYDVKTQIIGSDTVRFKAEIHYNAEVITKRRRSLHSVPSAEATNLFKELEGLQSDASSEDWLMKNDAEFLIAFAGEARRLQEMVRKELGEYSNVYVDLSVW